MRLGTKIKIKRWSAEKQRMEKRELVLMGKYRKYFGLFIIIRNQRVLYLAAAAADRAWRSMKR